MSLDRIPTIALPNSSATEHTTLHVFDHNGHRRPWNSSCGYFSELYLSRPGIVAFLAPVIPIARPSTYSDRPEGLHVPGLFIMSHQFDPRNDWVVAVEVDMGSDPGWFYRRILGRHELGDGASLYNAIHQAQKVLTHIPFQRIKLESARSGDSQA